MKLQPSGRAAALACWVLFGSGFVSLPAPGGGLSADDTSMSVYVRSRFSADRSSDLSGVRIIFADGTLYLSGAVRSPQEKVRAERIARESRGVSRVVNRIRVTRSRM